MPSNLKIFLLIGQSNMKGRGYVSDLSGPSFAGHPFYGSKIWNYKFSGVWQNPPVEPLHTTANSTYSVFVGSGGDNAGVGCGLFFADHFVRYTGFNVGLIPCAKGSASVQDWARPANGTDTSTLYGASRARWEAALASASGSTIAGLIYYQGEANSVSQEEADIWAAQFPTLIGNFRSDIGDANLPVVFVQLGPRDPIHDDWLYLRTKQAQIGRLGRTMMVTAKDLTLTDDSPHIDTASQRILGHRVSNAMRVLGAGL